MKKALIIMTLFILIIGGVILLKNKDDIRGETETVMGEKEKTEDLLKHSEDPLRGHGDPWHGEHEETERVVCDGVSDEILFEMRLSKEELTDKCQEYAGGYGYAGGAAYFEKREEDTVNKGKTYYQFTFYERGQEHPFTLIREVLDKGEDYWVVKDGTYGSFGDEN